MGVFNTILDQSTTSVLASGYSQFKTPLFKISVSLPGTKEPVYLPQQITRLIQKVEIIENYVSEGCSVDYFNIVFAEGSREPFSNDGSVDTSSIYGTDSLPGNTLTNNSGFLLDLRFTTKNGIQGITSLSKSAESAIVDVSNILDPLSQTTLSVNSDPTYLFQEGNIVTIEWGYVEFPKKRIIANPILMIQSDFPEAGQPTTTIICQSPVALLDQIAPPNGVNYKKVSGGSVNELGEIIVDYQDISTIDLLKSFCDDHGILPRISTDVLNDVLDKNAAKVWHAGQSFIEFLRHLARQSNCKFRIYIDPNSNYNYVMEFIKNPDMMSQSSIPSDMDALLTYKGVNSILKSFNVRADFAGLPAIAQVGLNSSGKSQAAVTGDGSDQTVLFATGNSLVNYDPTNKSTVAQSVVSKAFIKDESNITIPTNKVNVNPGADAPTVLSDTALAAFARCGNKQIAVEFKTLGYPLLMAGEIIKFSNVGQRYSTRYEVRTVTHTFDSTGYNCTGTALGFNLGGSIGIQPSAPKNFDQPKEQNTVVQFAALAANGIPQAPTDLVADSRNNRFVST